jgi:micrococcal nuclease
MEAQLSLDQFKPWTGTPNRGDFTVLVRGVHDGDSFTACLLVPIKCRVIGINSPELHHEGGREAKRITEELILGGMFTAKLCGTDKYGRTLADLLIDDRWLSDRLLKQGSAKPYDGHGPRP